MHRTFRHGPPGGPWLLSLILLTAIPATGRAQQSEHDVPMTDSLREGNRLHEVMKAGRVEGRFRQYTMLTINDGAPSDAHAAAFGGSLGFTSERWKGIRFRMSGGYTFDLATSDLTDPDAVTGLPNRYEIGLYDITAPRERNDVAYLQEFQLDRISRDGRSTIVFGRQILNTPFLNPQDGRMHPTFFEGLWTEHRMNSGTTLTGGWLYRTAPRSTSGWYGIAESMGLYPVGRGIDGKPSRYAGSLNSAGLLVGSLVHRWSPRITVSIWDVFAENIFNTGLLRVDRGGMEERWSLSGMAIRQDATASGSNATDSIAYMEAGRSTWVFSGRLRNVLGRFRWQLNYTRITAHGRYLMPREWGRDPFFTFLPRERNEGAGDVHAATLNLIWKDGKSGWRIQLDGGTYLMPEIADARLNKYAMPSYFQADVNLQYRFHAGWQGLTAQLLVLGKVPIDGADPTERQAFNKVDMLHADLVINYVF